MEATTDTATYDRPPNFEDLDPNLMTTGELLDLRLRYQKAIADIDHQFTMYEQQLDAGTKDPDPDWAERARYARECRLIDLERLDVVLAKRTEAGPGALHMAFVDAARERLDCETYADLMDAARENMQPLT